MKLKGQYSSEVSYSGFESFFTRSLGTFRPLDILILLANLKFFVKVFWRNWWLISPTCFACFQIAQVPESEAKQSLRLEMHANSLKRFHGLSNTQFLVLVESQKSTTIQLVFVSLSVALHEYRGLKVSWALSYKKRKIISNFPLVRLESINKCFLFKCKSSNVQASERVRNYFLDCKGFHPRSLKFGRAF